MLRTRSRLVDESSFEFAGQPVRLTSRETTLQVGWQPFAVAWTYRRPGHISLGDADRVHPIRDYGVATRVVSLVAALAAYMTRRRLK